MLLSGGELTGKYNQESDEPKRYEEASAKAMTVAEKLVALAREIGRSPARLDPDGWAVWEEEDYCRPPLAMERTAVLDHYFTNLIVQRVEEGQGWQEIKDLPALWSERES